MQEAQDSRHAIVMLTPLAETETDVLDLFGEPAAAGTHGRFESLVIPADCVVRISSARAAGGEIMAVCDDATDHAEAQELEENRRLKKLVYDLAGAMMGIAGARDPHTQGHELNVAHLARSIGHEMGLSAEDVEEISMAGLLYEIGKLGVPEDVFANPGKLSEAEFEQMKAHAARGSEILADIEFRGPIAEIVHQHHERMDGTGYPRGLKGDEILLGARVLAVADVVEAMMSPRPYRSAPGLDAAIEEIEAHPERYDGAVVAACVRVLRPGI